MLIFVNIILIVIINNVNLCQHYSYCYYKMLIFVNIILIVIINNVNLCQHVNKQC